MAKWLKNKKKNIEIQINLNESMVRGKKVLRCKLMKTDVVR